MCASILVVEDHADYQRNLREILQSEGHTVRAASTVSEAEREFREQPSEMLLLDLRLPDGSGLDLLDRVRSERPDLPAIVLTGNADLESALRAIRAGAKAYLRKDAPVEEILATVANVARTSELERERRALTEALRDSQEQLSRVLECAPDAILSTDLEARLTFVNRDVSGIPRERFMQEGMPLLDSIRAEGTRERWHRAVDEVRKTLQGVSHVQIVHVNRRTMRRYEYVANFAPILDAQGRLSGVMWILRDVTMQRELERKLADAERLVEERRRLAAIGEVVSGVAHEIQNPIQNVVMGIDLVRAKLGTDSPVERYLAQIERASESVRLLVRDLLDYSRSNRMDLEYVDLRTVVQAAIDESRGKAEQACVAIAWNPERPAPAMIDPPRMRQVLLNLLMNAIEALPRGGRVEPRVAALPDGGAEIVVWDDGPGMPADVVEKAFLPFFTTKARGTGLGLSIVQKIVQAHHGRVTLSSEPGKGTRIAIPLRPP